MFDLLFIALGARAVRPRRRLCRISAGGCDAGSFHWPIVALGLGAYLFTPVFIPKATEVVTP